MRFIEYPIARPSRAMTGVGIVIGWVLVAAAQVPAPPSVTSPEPITMSPSDRQACQELGLDAGQVHKLLAKPLYEFNESELDVYLRLLAHTEPDLRRRIVRLARKNLGQPYELYLLGEMPFETHDPQPLYCLSKSDCVVFAEHTYAMALGNDWSSFFRYLQRIRYRDGRIGVATRNHFTEADWNPSNVWLVGDITRELAEGKQREFRQQVDRASFLKKRYGLEVDIPVEHHADIYLPWSHVEGALPHLRDGDFVNVVRGDPETNGSGWVGHVGLIALDPQGQVNLIHSTKPEVREEPLAAYIARSRERVESGKPQLLGFKFLRLQSDPVGGLREIDGPLAPRVRIP